MPEPLPIDYLRVVRRDRAGLAMGLGIAACAIGAVATALSVLPLWGFHHMPVGTSMRPMLLVAWLDLMAAAGLFLALPLSLSCLGFGWRNRRALWIGLFGVLLSLSAVFLGCGLFKWIIDVRHFVMEL